MASKQACTFSSSSGVKLPFKVFNDRIFLAFSIVN